MFWLVFVTAIRSGQTLTLSRQGSVLTEVIDRATKTILGGDPWVRAAMWEMIAELDTRERLASPACPTLVLVGAEDASTTPHAAREWT